MKRVVASLVLAGGLIFAGGASAQDQYISEIRLFAGNFCPRGWLAANGAILPISQNTALFSLIGTQYGGDGRQTFALPNLIGRAPVGAGTDPTLGTYTVGEPLGNKQVTLQANQIPPHTHPLMGTTGGESSSSPANGLLPTFPAAQHIYNQGGAANTPLSPASIGPNNSGNLPVATQSPVLVANWCIATTGIFPSRP